MHPVYPKEPNIQSKIFKSTDYRTTKSTERHGFLALFKVRGTYHLLPERLIIASMISGTRMCRTNARPKLSCSARRLFASSEKVLSWILDLLFYKAEEIRFLYNSGEGRGDKLLEMASTKADPWISAMVRVRHSPNVQ
jgi:hypothetical protein